MSTALDCRHYTAAECRSCTWLERPYDAQLVAKAGRAADLLAGVLDGRPEPAWLPPAPSPVEGFRNKAKMVVAGTADRPTLGILDPRGGGVDLRDCALHTPGIRAALPTLAEFVGRAALAPYDVPGRSGELKHVLVTESPTGGLLVRWVLRSTEALARIRKHLPWLREALPAVRVVTVNVQPVHRAVIEGDREIVLTERTTLPVPIGGVTLRVGPRSFLQTNTAIATALYAEARDWVATLAPATVWDLYCGVGGFALHLAAPGRDVLGVEISADAVASATLAAQHADGRVSFAAGDATAYARAADPGDRPDLVVVNPPRRGLGDDLAGWLEASGVAHVLYSSCNPETLARDVANLRSYDVVRGRVFDMFPHTAHAEVLVLLTRR